MILGLDIISTLDAFDGPGFQDSLGSCDGGLTHAAPVSYPTKDATSLQTIRNSQRGKLIQASHQDANKGSIVGSRQTQALDQTGGVVSLTVFCYMAHLRFSGSTSAAHRLVGQSLAS